MLAENERIMEEAYKALASGDYINAFYLFNQNEMQYEGDKEVIYNYDYALIYIRMGSYDEALEKLDKALREEKNKLFSKKDESTMVSLNKQYMKLLKEEDTEGSFFKPLPYIINRVADYYQICIKRMMAYCYYKIGDTDMLKIIISDLVQKYGKESFNNFLKLVRVEC